MIEMKFSTALVCGLLAVSGAARAGYIVQTASNEYLADTGYTNTAEYNFNQTGPLFNFPHGTGTGTTDPTGTAISAFDSSSLGDSNGGASGYAYANLANGKLGVMGSAGGYYSQVTLQAQYRDVLHYTVAGANSSTVTDIGITFAIDGSMVESGAGVAQLIGGITLDNAAESVSIGDSLSGGVCMNGPCVYSKAVSGYWVNPVFTPSSVGLVVFNGTYALTGASGDVDIFATLSLTSAVNGVSGTANDDYSHTGALSLSLPQGVSYTSDSGVLLTQVNPTPEPGTMWLAGLTLAALGVVRPRKKLR